MSRYNTNKPATANVVTNFQGGQGIKLDPKMELISILSTGMDNSYYEKLGERETRFSEVIKEVAKKDIVFLAKALIYARSVMGQRSVTHFGAVQLAQYLSGHKVARKFFSKRDRKKETGGIIYRLDDMLEIIACYQALNPNKPLPNSMKNGFKLALESADTYELAKYQGTGKSVSLIDVVNLVHPKPSKEMEETFKKLMSGELKQHNTVEDKNTTSGQNVAKKVKSGEITKEQAAVELKEAKSDNYRELISNKTIGYLALIRNLKNILTNATDSDLITSACALLANPEFIKRSLVFPYQIDLAMEFILTEVSSANKGRTEVMIALNKAYELSIPNMSEMGLHGRTAVVIDTSGSMSSKIRMSGKGGYHSALEKGALIAATFAKGLKADVYQFSNICARVNVNTLDTVNTIKNQIISQQLGSDTKFNTIFTELMKGGKYDRVFVVSDMQGADSIITKINNKYHDYVNQYGQPYIYAVDMCGYGTTMFKNNNKVFQLFGYSAEMFELAKRMEINPKAIIKEIEAIVI